MDNELRKIEGMGRRSIPAKGWDAEDLFNSSKHVYHWRPGEAARIKRRHRRKERKFARRIAQKWTRHKADHAD